eukprot:g12763.t1
MIFLFLVSDEACAKLAGRVLYLTVVSANYNCVPCADMEAWVEDEEDDASSATEDDDYGQDISDSDLSSDASDISDADADDLTPRELRNKIWPRGILDIVNMVLLDGGAKAPVIASWDAFRKMVDRRTAHVTSVYLLCPNGCRGGAMKLNSLNLRSLPRTCTFCRGDIKLDGKTLPQYVLRHFNVEEQLRSILQRRVTTPSCSVVTVRPYVNLDATRIQCLHVPADMKKCPAWREHVQDPSEIVLAFYFDGVPAFRGVKYGTYSLHAVSLEILNLPFFLRADPRFTLVSDIVQGPKSPKNFRPVFLPLVEELKGAGYEVLFASTDYQAKTQLLQHRFLGYEGCCKCFLRSKFVQTGTFDWSTEEGKDPARRKTQRDAVRLGRNARIAGTPQDGFHDNPCLVEVQRERISQTPRTPCTWLFAASEPDDRSLDILDGLVKRFDYLHRKLMQPPCRPLQFHRLEHGVESVKEFGPVFIYWCFRSERLMGRLVKMLRRRNGIGAHLAAVIRRVQLGWVMCGLLGPAEQALEHFVLESAAARALRRTGTAEAKLKLKLSALAAKVMARRERRGYRLNLEKFPEGAPLRVRGSWRNLAADEERAFE